MTAVELHFEDDPWNRKVIKIKGSIYLRFSLWFFGGPPRHRMFSSSWGNRSTIKNEPSQATLQIDKPLRESSNDDATSSVQCSVTPVMPIQ